MWQYYRDDPNDKIVDSESFKFKINITGKTPAAGNTKDVKTAVPLIYFSNFWRTLEMHLINCEINLILTWPENFVVSSATGKTKLAITDAKIYVKVVTLSTQDIAKLLEQLRPGFKGTINWNKYQSKVSTERQNQYLGLLIGPSSQGVNRLFVLLFENENGRKVHKGYFLQKIEIKDYNAMIVGRGYFDQPVKSNTKTYDNIRKIATGQGDDCTTGCLLDYNYFNKHYKMIAIDKANYKDLSK